MEENGTISDWVFVSLFFYYTVLHVEETRSFISFASCHAGRQQHGFHDEVCVLDFFCVSVLQFLLPVVREETSGKIGRPGRRSAHNLSDAVDCAVRLTFM